ncbi:PIN domain-containing protein [Streptomyces sp. NBC_01304]|uniref:PIN domain-containing protein n=1 Tax=Streptomyces sp. NBC_01304 TaxID=2903818 RepID=UPI002E0D67EF|nr:PIN domain-containing protein [Streptomyces sp. NBC_01304]
MIQYLIDSSALWRIQRSKELRTAWTPVISAGSIGSCWLQRAEFRASARSGAEYDRMTDMFATLYPDVPVPKSAPQWIESTQYRLAQAGEHKALSALDLVISATAAFHHLTVLHDDNDFATAARTARDLRERNIHNMP